MMAPQIIVVPSGSFPSPTSPAPAPATERLVFEISPTIKPHLLVGVFTLGLWLPFVVLAWVTNQATKYRLTTERLLVQQGLVGRRIEEVELFRIKDVTLNQGNVGRLLGYGNVVVHMNDSSTPRLVLHYVSNPVQVKEQIRDQPGLWPRWRQQHQPLLGAPHRALPVERSGQC